MMTGHAGPFPGCHTAGNPLFQIEQRRGHGPSVAAKSPLNKFFCCGLGLDPAHSSHTQSGCCLGTVRSRLTNRRNKPFPQHVSQVEGKSNSRCCADEFITRPWGYIRALYPLLHGPPPSAQATPCPPSPPAQRGPSATVSFGLESARQPEESSPRDSEYKTRCPRVQCTNVVRGGEGEQWVTVQGILINGQQDFRQGPEGVGGGRRPAHFQSGEHCQALCEDSLVVLACEGRQAQLTTLWASPSRPQKHSIAQPENGAHDLCTKLMFASCTIYRF